jgi:hypothetical protein
MRINVVAHEMIEQEALLHAVIAGQLALLVSDERTDRRADPACLRRVAQCRDLTALRVDELLAAQEACAMVEQRYLDGHAALFPDVVEQWAERLRFAQELAVMAERLAELDGVPPADPADPDTVPTRAAVLVAEPCRTRPLDGPRQA